MSLYRPDPKSGDLVRPLPSRLSRVRGQVLSSESERNVSLVRPDLNNYFVRSLLRWPLRVKGKTRTSPGGWREIISNISKYRIKKLLSVIYKFCLGIKILSLISQIELCVTGPNWFDSRPTNGESSVLFSSFYLTSFRQNKFPIGNSSYRPESRVSW